MFFSISGCHTFPFPRLSSQADCSSRLFLLSAPSSSNIPAINFVYLTIRCIKNQLPPRLPRLLQSTENTDIQVSHFSSAWETIFTDTAGTFHHIFSQLTAVLVTVKGGKEKTANNNHELMCSRLVFTAPHRPCNTAPASLAAWNNSSDGQFLQTARPPLSCFWQRSR